MCRQCILAVGESNSSCHAARFLRKGSRFAKLVCGIGTGANFREMWLALNDQKAKGRIKDACAQDDLGALFVEFFLRLLPTPNVTVLDVRLL